MSAWTITLSVTGPRDPPSHPLVATSNSPPVTRLASVISQRGDEVEVLMPNPNDNVEVAIIRGDVSPT